MALQNTQTYGLPINFSATALLYTGPGNVTGFFVNSHTNGTLKLWDSLTATGTVLFNTMTFNSGPGDYSLFGAKFTTGLFATVGGSAADITLIYNPRNG